MEVHGTNPFLALKEADEWTVTFFPLVFYDPDNIKVKSKNLYFKFVVYKTILPSLSTHNVDKIAVSVHLIRKDIK